jgi:hypothetical protein
MVMSYTTLVADKNTAGSIKSWLNYGKIDSEGVLEDAQAMIYERLRVREMKARDTANIKVGASSCDLPDGFLDPIKLTDITNDVRLIFKESDELEDMMSFTDGVLDSGDPAYFDVAEEVFNFDCKTTTAWTLRSLFYKTPDPLSASAPKNFLTTRYPHLLRMACIATGARFADDEAVFGREQKLLWAEIAEIAAGDEMARSSDVPVEM